MSQNNLYFNITKEQLSELFDPAKIQEKVSQKKLELLGGIQKIQNTLKVELKYGLSQDNEMDIEQRISQFGTNYTPETPMHSIWFYLAEASEDFCVIILTIAGFALFSLGFVAENPEETWIQAATILMAILMVVLIGGISNYRKEIQFRDLAKGIDQKQVTVLRDSTFLSIDHTQLLVGDILAIGVGDLLTVDVLVLKGNYFEIDESQITGQSDTIIKGYDKNHTMDSFIVSGSNILEGTGYAMVCCVGENSFLGKLNSKIDKSDSTTNILNQNIANLAKIMVKAGCCMATLMFCILFSYLYNEIQREGGSLTSKESLNVLIDIFIESMLVIILSVPEGLPMVLTLSLAYSVNEMRKDDIMVRKLNSCYVMGGASHLCIDKTGTLTMCNLKVESTFMQNNQELFQYKQTEIKNQKLDFNFLTTLCEALISTSNTGQLVNNSVCLNNSGGSQSPNQTCVPSVIRLSKTDSALLKFVQLLHPQMSQDTGRIIRQIPFYQTQKYNAIILQKEDDTYRIYMKGNSDFILQQSSYIYENNGNIENLNDEQRNQIDENIIGDFGKQSLRPIAVAYKDFKVLPKKENERFLEEELTLISILGLEDSLRSNAKDNMIQLQESGIQVRMLTGDNINNAINFAQQAKIIDEQYDEEAVMDGDQFEEQVGDLVLNEDTNQLEIKDINKFTQLASKLKVLARASSDQKNLLIKGLVQSNQIVAYVGDGNNDASALKSSDVGFAMGVQSSDIAKDSSSIIMLKDNLSNLVCATRWGRNIYENIHRFLFFQISFFIVSIFLIVISAVTTGESPLSVVQIIWLSLIHDVFSAFALSLESPSENVLKRKPFNRGEYVITKYLFTAIMNQVVYQTVVLLIMLHYIPESNLPKELLESWDQDGLGHRNTLIFNTIAWMQVFTLINARRIQIDEYNVFKKIMNNSTFIWTFWGIAAVQIFLVEFAGPYAKCVPLSINEHFYTIFLGYGTCLFFLFMKIAINIMDKVPEKVYRLIPFSQENQSLINKNPFGIIKSLKKQ